MHLTILGSGTCEISLKRGCSGISVRVENKNCLVDLGPGTLHKLLLIGLTVHDIDIICITHFHPDHITDIIPFLFLRKYTGPKQKKGLTLIGGVGFKHFLLQLNDLFRGSLLPDPLDFEIMELINSAYKKNNISIKTATLSHNKESIGIKIENKKGEAVVISGDTDYCQEIIDLSKNADLLVLESTCLDDNTKVVGHLTPYLAGKIAQAAAVKTLILTHLNKNITIEAISPIVKREFKGNFFLARDLNTYTL